MGKGPGNEGGTLQLFVETSIISTIIWPQPAEKREESRLFSVEQHFFDSINELEGLEEKGISSGCRSSM